MNTNDDVKTRRRPPSQDEAGLRAVAAVGKAKGQLGIDSLKEGLRASANSSDRYTPGDPGDKLRKRVQGIYDRKVATRKRLADAKPSAPEDAASEKMYGSRKKKSALSGSEGRLGGQ